MPKVLASEPLAAGQSWVLIKILTEEVRLKPRLKTESESVLIIVSGNEFQTVGAEQRKARLAKSVLVNCLSSSGTASLDVTTEICRCCGAATTLEGQHSHLVPLYLC